MRCDYCDSKFQVSKFKYVGKTPDGKKRQKTMKFCLDCQCHGVASSRNRIAEIWDIVDENSIENSDGSEMRVY